MRTKLTLVTILLGFLIIPGACTPSPSLETTVPPPTDTCYPAGYSYIDYTSGNDSLSRQGKFELTRVVWGPFSIYVLGSADLAEGTRIRAKLYKDDKAIVWWPANYGAKLVDGVWDFYLKAGEFNTTEELPEFGPGYSLWIWNTDDPAITAQLSLASPGPPEETRIHSSEGAVTLELDGSKWQLVSLNGTVPLSNTQITLEFQEEQATGRSGCNFYGAKYLTKAPNLLNLLDLTVTLIGCDEPILAQEQAYIQYLNKAICYRVDGNSLELYDVITNKRTLVFERQP
jgi:heat shock protein HslJ